MTLVPLKLGAYRKDIPKDTSDGFSVRLARKLQSVKIKRGKCAPTQICCGFTAFEEKGFPVQTHGKTGHEAHGAGLGMGSAVRQVVRWELWGEVSRALIPRAPWAPSFLPLGRNSAGTASQHVAYTLTGCSCPGHSRSHKTAAVTCCQMWPDSPATRTLRTAGEASRSGPKGSSLLFALWDVRSDRHTDGSWSSVVFMFVQLFRFSRAALFTWRCHKQLCTAGHQVSASKKCAWRSSCHQLSVFRSRSVEVVPSFLEMGIDFPVP